MTDATRVLPPGWRALDASGNIIAGGIAPNVASLEFYQAGTSTPRTVFSDFTLSTSLGTIVYLDSGGYTVASQGSSTKVLIYTGINAYKVILKDSGGATVWTHDNIIGALDTSPFTATTALPKTPVVSRTSPFTAVSADRGKVFNCSGATFTVTLDSAANLGDNWRACIRHDDGVAGRQYRIVTTGGDLISLPSDVTTTAFSLTGRGESVWLVCSGAGFSVDSYAPPLMRPNGMGAIIITDRVSAAPGSPTAGARYIVTAGFSTFEAQDIIEADGQGGFIEYTPATDCGWIAYVQDEDIYYYFRASAWVPETATSSQQGTARLATQAEVNAGIVADATVTPATLKNLSWIAVEKTADESVTSSTTLQDDDHLFFAVAANTKYRFRLNLVLTCAAAADYKYTFTGPAAPTFIAFGHNDVSDDTTADFGAASAFGTSIDVTSAGTIHVAWISGVLHNGANAGTVTFQFAQVASNVTPTVNKAGGYLEFRAIS